MGRRLALELRVALAFVAALVAAFLAFVDRARPALAVAFALAATALVAGLVSTLRQRPRAASARRRWGRRALSAVAAVLLLYFVVVPVGGAIWLAQKPRDAVRPLSRPHLDVTLQTSDGVRLAAWYVPSRNGAAVVLVHGAGGNRDGLRLHLELLARHGYGVLAYDARGRGESTGRTHGMGWTWQPDVRAAVDYLQRRPDVDPDRIGALGLSTGAEVLLEAAARDRRLRAVVADGAIARNLAETRQLGGADEVLGVPFYAVEFAALRLLTWSSPSPPLQGLVPRIHAPVLLVSTGTGIERTMNRAYHGAAPRTALWELPDVGHTHGLRDRPDAYGHRVLGFLHRALRSER